MEEDFAFKATHERQKREQKLRQNKLALEAAELVVKTRLLEAAKEASNAAKRNLADKNTLRARANAKMVQCMRCDGTGRAGVYLFKGWQTSIV